MRHRRGSNRGRQPAVFRARSHPGISPDPAHLFFSLGVYTRLDWIGMFSPICIAPPCLPRASLDRKPALGPFRKFTRESIEASASYKRPDFRIAADCGRLRFASRPLGISKACRFPSPQSKPHVQTRSQSQSANDPVLISMGSWKRPSFCRTLNRCRLRPASSWMTIFGGPRDLELFIRPSKPRASNPKHRRTATCRLRSFLRSVFFTKLKPLGARL